MHIMTFTVFDIDVGPQITSEIRIAVINADINGRTQHSSSVELITFVPGDRTVGDVVTKVDKVFVLVFGLTPPVAVTICNLLKQFVEMILHSSFSIAPETLAIEGDFYTQFVKAFAFGFFVNAAQQGFFEQETHHTLHLFWCVGSGSNGLLRFFRTT